MIIHFRSARRPGHAAAQVQPATLHAALSTQDWRMLMDMGLGCYSPPPGPAEAQADETADDDAKACAAAGGAPMHAHALAMLQAYLQAPDAMQAEGQDSGVIDTAQLEGCDILQRLHGLELLAAPVRVADAYAAALASAAAESTSLFGWLVSCVSSSLDGL